MPRKPKNKPACLFKALGDNNRLKILKFLIGYFLNLMPV